MIRSIKFILAFALFVLGITTAGDAWIKESPAEINISAATVSGNNESEHASFTMNISATNHHPFYDDAENNSAFDICNAILSQNPLLNGVNPPKVIKNSSAVRSMRTTGTLLSQEKNISTDSGNYAARSTYRYYVYALRHIII